jgi:hypothetical protein
MLVILNVRWSILLQFRNHRHGLGCRPGRHKTGNRPSGASFVVVTLHAADRMLLQCRNMWLETRTPRLPCLSPCEVRGCRHAGSQEGSLRQPGQEGRLAAQVSYHAVPGGPDRWLAAAGAQLALAASQDADLGLLGFEGNPLACLVSFLCILVQRGGALLPAPLFQRVLGRVSARVGRIGKPGRPACPPAPCSPL